MPLPRPPILGSPPPKRLKPQPSPFKPGLHDSTVAPIGRMQTGGKFTRPIPISHREWKQKLIAEIKTLQNTSG
jgi:hypothetical protein